MVDDLLRQKRDSVSAAIRERANSIVLGSAVLFGLAGLVLLPIVRLWATGGVEIERWRTSIITNATAMLFFTVWLSTWFTILLANKYIKNRWIRYAAYIIPVGTMSYGLVVILDDYTVPLLLPVPAD